MSVHRLALLALFASTLGWAGCHTAEPRPRRPVAAGLDERSAAPAPKPWLAFDRLDDENLVGVIDSAHPAGDLFGTIRVNAQADAYGKKRGGPLPSGARVIEALGSSPEGPADLYYVMEKQASGYFPEGGDWAYFVIGKGGEIRAEGKLKLCARCHAEAPREHLFESFRVVPSP